jgi:hypothetical protein
LQVVHVVGPASALRHDVIDVGCRLRAPRRQADQIARQHQRRTFRHLAPLPRFAALPRSRS